MTEQRNRASMAHHLLLTSAEEMVEVLAYEGTPSTVLSALRSAKDHAERAILEIDRMIEAAEVTPAIPLHPASKLRAPLNFDPSTALVGGILLQSLKAKQQ